MIGLIMASFMGLPDIRQKADLNVITEPAGFTVHYGDQACQTPCTLHIPTGARIELTLDIPGYIVTTGTRTHWVRTLDPLHLYRLAPDVVIYHLEKTQ